MSSNEQWDPLTAYDTQSDDLLQQTMEEEMEFAEQQQEPAPQTPQDAVEELDEINVDEAAEWVASNCSYFCYSVSNPPQSRTIPRHEIEVIASHAHADPTAVTTQLKIFDPKEFPVIKEGRAIQKRFDALITRYAIPKQTLVRSLAAKTAGDNGVQQVVDNERDKGRYMILNANIEEFVEKFNEVLSDYMDWGQRLITRYEQIRERDRTRLAGFWDLIQHKYPSRVYVENSIRVRAPSFQSANHVMSTAHLPQAMRSAITEQAKTEAASQVQQACDSMMEALLDAVTLATKQLGKRTRVNPKIEDGDYAHLRDGEVALFEAHEDDKDNIPVGFVRVKIQLVHHWENGKRTNKRDQRGNQVQETLVISDEEFQERLRPRQSGDEYCRLFDGQIQNLIDMGEKFQKFEGLLSVGNSPLKSFSDQVQGLLAEHGHSSGAITERLKNSGYRRDSLCGQLTDLRGALAQQLVVQTKKKKVSRRNLSV